MTKIPSIEKVYDAGQMLTQMRDDLVAAEQRCDLLEKSIKEMSQDHADALDDMRGAHESEVTELRSALQASEKLNKYLDELLHVHEANGNIRLLASERVGTIAKAMRDFGAQCFDDWAKSETDALDKDLEMRRKPKPEPVTYNYPEGPVEVRQFDTAEFARRISGDDDLTEGAEFADETPIVPDNEEIPAFLRRQQPTGV
jgi:hypothetical protein